LLICATFAFFKGNAYAISIAVQNSVTLFLVGSAADPLLIGGVLCEEACTDED